MERYTPGLKAPVSYLRMQRDNPRELNKIVGGCGPGKLGDIFVPDTMWGLSVTEACRIHDYMYHVGSTPKDKWNADLTFLCNLIVICWNKTESPLWKLKFTLRALRAIKYFVAVALGGDGAFDKVDNKPEKMK